MVSIFPIESKYLTADNASAGPKFPAEKFPLMHHPSLMEPAWPVRTTFTVSAILDLHGLILN